MSPASEVTIKALECVVKPLPIGTNLAPLSGAFLCSRGAVFPALRTLGLSAVEIRWSSQAVRAGAWSGDTLVTR